MKIGDNGPVQLTFGEGILDREQYKVEPINTHAYNFYYTITEDYLQKLLGKQ